MTKSFASEGVHESCTEVDVQRESLSGSCVHGACMEIPISHAEPPAFPLLDNALLTGNSKVLLENAIVFDYKKLKKRITIQGDGWGTSMSSGTMRGSFRLVFLSCRLPLSVMF